jgi:hypothetical protein
VRRRTAATTGQSVEATGSRARSAWFPFSKAASAFWQLSSPAVEAKRHSHPAIKSGFQIQVTEALTVHSVNQENKLKIQENLLQDLY